MSKNGQEWEQMKLSGRQIKAIQALLSSSTIEEAAKKTGLCRRTLTGYLSDPDFQREYSKAAHSRIQEATRSVQGYLTDAIQTLHDIATDINETSGNRISASRSILEYGLRMTEFADILPVVDNSEE